MSAPLRVLVTSAASSPGIDLARSLRRDPSVVVVGADARPAGRRMAARLCHEVVALPRADTDPAAYADALDAAATGADVLFVSLDVEVEALVAADRVPAVPCPVPFDCAAVILDKERTAAALPDDLVPATALVEGPDGLTQALEWIPPPVWLRPATGTSGQGSLRVDDAEEGRVWMEFWRRRGVEAAWMVQAFLPGRNLNWTALYREGEKVAEAAMERDAYLLASVSVSGVTGQVRRCTTVSLPAWAAAGERAVASLSERPHGLYSVDLRGDAEGRPRITEVNPRPAGRPWLYTEAGVNLPLAAARVLSGRSVGDAVAEDGLRTGVSLHRQIDVEPLVTEAEPREPARSPGSVREG